MTVTSSPEVDSHRKRALMMFLTLLVLSATWIGCGVGSTETLQVGDHSQPVIAVRLADVERGERSHTIESGGRLALKAEVSLSFKTGGVVESVSADEGRRVRRGQLLAQLDLSEIEARSTQARAALGKAERDLARAQDLYDDGAATLEQVQNVRTALEVARSDLDIAEFNVHYSVIRAPVSGSVLRRLIEPGEVVSPGQAVFVLGSEDSGWVMRLGLADRDIVRIGLGDPAAVELDAYPGQSFEARVEQIAETSDPRTGTFEVELKLPAPSLPLKSGFVGRAVIEPRVSTVATSIPIEALIRADGREGLVYAYDPSSEQLWRPVPITIDRLQGDDVLVASGLDGVDQVIVSGAHKLTAEARVRLAEPTTGAPLDSGITR